MKKTFTAFVLMAAMAATPGLAIAHCGHCGMGDSDKSGDPMAAMTKNLGLSDDQKGKIKTIHDDAHQKMDALMEETHKQIRALLTPEQQTKFDAMKKDGEGCAMCRTAGKGGKGKAHDHAH